MNIDDLTIKQARELAAIFGSKDAQQTSPHIGKKCIIRTYASGVHFGELVSQSGRQVELRSSRRIWRFDAAPDGISLSEVANHGSTGSRAKICETVAAITVLDALEIIPCTEKAVAAIEAAKVAQPS